MTRMTWKKFSPDVVNRLFQAIDEDDIINNETTLPATVPLDCSAQNIHDYYSLCLQLWEEGFTRLELLALIQKLLAGKELTGKERKQYKFIRARYKHLRFAQRLYSHNHDAGFIFKMTTVYLGHLQDGFKNNDPQRIQHYGKRLSLLLSKPIWSLVQRSLRTLKLDSTKGFHQHAYQQMAILKTLLQKPLVTGTEFHDIRKIISQQVSFFDTQRSINTEDQQSYEISRVLANINGLMGDQHDVMVAEKLSGIKDYETPTALTPQIRFPLEQLIQRI